MKAYICVIIRDCAEIYVKEWLNWHFMMGFNHIFIYDNESKTPINSYIDDEKVTIINWPGEYQQFNAYNHFIVTHPSKNWCAFIDDDEFIVIEGNRKIKDILESHSCYSLGINWLRFGSSGLSDFNTKPQTHKFLYRTDKDYYSNTHVKTIARIDNIYKIDNPHYCLLKSGASRDIDNNIILGHHTDYPRDNKIWINHYYTRSLNEWYSKLERGRADGMIYNKYKGDVFEIDRDCNVYDDRAMKMVNNAKK